MDDVNRLTENSLQKQQKRLNGRSITLKLRSWIWWTYHSICYKYNVKKNVINFVFLGSKVIPEKNILGLHVLITKTTGAYAELRKIWRSASISINAILRNLKSNVLWVVKNGTAFWKELTKSLAKYILFRHPIVSTERYPYSGQIKASWMMSCT